MHAKRAGLCHTVLELLSRSNCRGEEKGKNSTDMSEGKKGGEAVGGLGKKYCREEQKGMKKVNNMCTTSEFKLFKTTVLVPLKKKKMVYNNGLQGFFGRVVIPLGTLTPNFLPAGSNGRCNFLLAHKQTMHSTEVRLKILQCHLQRSRGTHQS